MSKRGLVIVGTAFAALVCFELVNSEIARPREAPVEVAVGVDDTEYDTESGDDSPIGAFPDGEWWGVARDFVVVVSLDKLNGHAAMSLRDQDVILSVVFSEPEIKLTKIDPATGQRTSFSMPNGDELLYTLTGADTLTSWDARVPELRHDGSECEDLDQMRIIKTSGAYGAGQPEFRLNWSQQNDPKKMCTATQLKQVARLRRLLAAKKK